MRSNSKNRREQRIESLRKAKAKLENRKTIKRKKRLAITTSVSIAAAALIASFIIFYPNSEPQTIAKERNEINMNKILVPTIISSNGTKFEINNRKKSVSNATVINKSTISYTNNNNTAKSEQITFEKIVIPCHYSYTVILSDSSEVTLNAGSELIFPTNFEKDKREVKLTGEAYFKVSKSKIPFIVKTSELSIKVYGTEFNINTSKLKSVDALLVSGKIGVKSNNSITETIIYPNQLFTLDKQSGEAEVKDVNIDNYIAWRSDLFQCDNENLDVILQEIAQWYGLEFEYKNEDVKVIKIDIKISRKIKQENILKAIEKIINVKITNKGNNKYVIDVA